MKSVALGEKCDLALHFIGARITLLPYSCDLRWYLVPRLQLVGCWVFFVPGWPHLDPQFARFLRRLMPCRMLNKQALPTEAHVPGAIHASHAPLPAFISITAAPNHAPCLPVMDHWLPALPTALHQVPCAPQPACEQ